MSVGISQHIAYKLVLTKEQVGLITKGLTGALKARELEEAGALALSIIQGAVDLAEERLGVVEGAKVRASELIAKQNSTH